MRLLRRWPSSVTLIAQRDAAEGAVVFAKACELGLEGIVSKRVGSRYLRGTSRAW
jgi:ATP-dependent DNA ligase